MYGNPILFGWDGLKLEAYLLREVRETDKSHKEEKIQKHISNLIKFSSKNFNETFLAEDPDMKSSYHNKSLIGQFIRGKIEEVDVEDQEMAMAVMMKNVRVDHIIYSLFNKRVGGTNWLVNLDVGKIFILKLYKEGFLHKLKTHFMIS